MNRFLRQLGFFAMIILVLSGWREPERPGRKPTAAVPVHKIPILPFKVLAVASRASDHVKMIAAARPFLEQMARDNNFTLDFTDDTSRISDAGLADYQVFVMLDLAPFDMSYGQQAALQKFVEQGKGWVGIHAAGLTGKDFLIPGMRYWQWFEDFMGGVIYSPHPAYQKGTVIIEDHTHPVTHNLPAKLEISDEWYEYTTSPRARVRVLASADESTYHQNRPMGDHPIVWTNERYRRMIYICIGHDPSILKNEGYAMLWRNAILWAGSEDAPKDVSGIAIPMKNKIISYEKSYVLNDKQALYDRALRWFAKTFPGSHADGSAADREAGKLSGTGFFKVITSGSGNHYWLKFDVDIRITDGGYSFTACNYYEKPVEKGISNEYSKIEYRWWDFRQGHPWSPEDRALFRGLDRNTLQLMNSLEKEMRL